MVNEEKSTKIVNFMNPGADVFVLGCGHISWILQKMNVLSRLLNSPSQLLCKYQTNSIYMDDILGAGVTVRY